MMNDLSNCRNVPKNPQDRAFGEGDRVLRDRENRICYFYEGTEDAIWNRLKKDPTLHEDIIRFDPVEGITR